MSKRKPFLLYHWSPVERRKSILHDGLCPWKKPMLQGNSEPEKGWRAPWVCFAASPSLAWALSATHSKQDGLWDLWMCWSDVAEFWSQSCGKEKYMREYRTTERIHKRKIWHVGTRYFDPKHVNR